LVDVVLATVSIAELAMAAAGTGISFMVSELAGRAPKGWIFLSLAFLVFFLRGCIVTVALLFGVSLDSFFLVIQLFTLPVVVLVLFGVYYLYVDFKRQISSNQTAILTSADEGHP
jgi:hypothetical protein